MFVDFLEQNVKRIIGFSLSCVFLQNLRKDSIESVCDLSVKQFINDLPIKVAFELSEFAKKTFLSFACANAKVIQKHFLLSRFRSSKSNEITLSSNGWVRVRPAPQANSTWAILWPALQAEFDSGHFRFMTLVEKRRQPTQFCVFLWRVVLMGAEFTGKCSIHVCLR